MIREYSLSSHLLLLCLKNLHLRFNRFLQLSGQLVWADSPLFGRRVASLQRQAPLATAERKVAVQPLGRIPSLSLSGSMGLFIDLLIDVLCLVSFAVQPHLGLSLEV